MPATKIAAGSTFPSIKVATLGGGDVDLAKPGNGHDWRMVVVYRGKHCPICTRYLGELNDALPDLNAQGVDVVAVSADTGEQAKGQIDPIAPKYDVGFGLNVEQMQALGLYISDPRSEKETDHPFPEPGLFVINDKGEVQIVDISNAPFARPSFAMIANGIKFIRNPDNNYPIRGTRA